MAPWESLDIIESMLCCPKLLRTPPKLLLALFSFWPKMKLLFLILVLFLLNWLCCFYNNVLSCMNCWYLTFSWLKLASYEYSSQFYLLFSNTSCILWILSVSDAPSDSIAKFSFKLEFCYKMASVFSNSLMVWVCDMIPSYFSFKALLIWNFIRSLSCLRWIWQCNLFFNRI